MSTLPSVNQMHPDWLDALAVLRRVIDSHDIKPVWEQFEPWPKNEAAQNLLVARKGERIKLFLFPEQGQKFEDLPKVERVELMLFAAVTAHISLWSGVDPNLIADRARFSDAFEAVCQRAGCCSKNTAEIRERWRLIDYYTPMHLLPIYEFEDRQRCRLCGGRIATGAGAWVKGREIAAELVYKRDVHDGCMHYAHRVLVPQLNAIHKAEAVKSQTHEGCGGWWVESQGMTFCDKCGLEQGI